MSGSLTASFTLRLVDQLSGPMRALQERFEGLRAMAARFSLDAFRDGTSTIEGTTRATTGLERGLTGVGSAAEVAGSRMRDMGRQAEQAATAATRAMEQAARTPMGPGAQAFAANGFRPTSRGGAYGPAETFESWSARAPLGEDFRPNRLRGYGAEAIPWMNGGAGGHDQMGDLIAASGGAMIADKLFGLTREAASYENPMVHTAISAGLTGDAADAKIAQMRDAYDRMALATGQRAPELAATGLDVQNLGVSAALADSMTAVAAKAATAYNADQHAVGMTAFHLNENLGVSTADMGQAMAILATAGKHGHFDMAKMATYLPTVAASMGGSAGMGLEGARDLGADLQVAFRDVGFNEPEKAATRLTDLGQYLSSPFGARAFARHGVDLGKLRADAAAKGIPYLDAVMAKVEQMSLQFTHGKNAADPMVLGSLFHNQDARLGANSLITHRKELEDLRELLKTVDVHTIDKDFDEASRHLEFATKRFDASLEVLTTRLGFAFAPALRGASFAMDRVSEAFIWLDKTVPGASTAVISTVGAFAALVAGVGGFLLLRPALTASWQLLGAIFSPARTALIWLFSNALTLGGLAVRGFGIAWTFLSSVFEGGLIAMIAANPILAGIIALIVILAGAVYEVYENWGTFSAWMAGLWTRVRTAWGDFAAWASGFLDPIFDYIRTFFQNHIANIDLGEIFTIDVPKVVDRILHPLFGGMRDWIQAHGLDAPTLLKSFDTNAAAVRAGFGHGAGGSDVDEDGNPLPRAPSTIQGINHGTPVLYGAPAAQPVTGTITIVAPPGTTATATSDNPGLKFNVDNGRIGRGPTLSRP